MMSTTFGQRLKNFRKQQGYTQQELAEAINVSTQAISKWETDVGMPDISQIVPLSRVLDITTDILLGVVDENDNAEFDAVYEKCMEIERGNPCAWPPAADRAQEGFRIMYDFFCAHPNHPQAAKYLLDMAELYWGKFDVFADEAYALKECERFSNCIFRYSDDADLCAEARFLMASVWARVGKKDKADELLTKMPFRYGDRCYWSAEVALLSGDFEEAEARCKESFTYRARFLYKCVRMMAKLPGKTEEERLAYEEYALRIVNAVLSGGAYMPQTQVFHKMTLLVSLIDRNWSMGRNERAVECFKELICTVQDFLVFVEGGSIGGQLLLADDALENYAGSDSEKPRREMALECLRRAVVYGQKAGENKYLLQSCVAEAQALIDRFEI